MPVTPFFSFMQPTCGHCKESAPKLKAFYDKNKAVEIKVMTISTEHNAEEWKSFLTTYHLEELINTFDTLKQYDFNPKIRCGYNADDLRVG